MTKIWYENLVANCTKVAINEQWSMIDNKIDKNFIFSFNYMFYIHIIRFVWLYSHTYLIKHTHGYKYILKHDNSINIK